ncbi:hypothetical protein V6N11_018442 [Hibiscus sabdariffa]|uniref:Uncharacterized protein n=1 Tax=Hibiscus sabdariffa TaxID=183260 RepID=A0ABR2T818_9ROSI
MPVCPCVTSLTGGGWFFDVQFCLAAPWWRYGVLLAAPWWPWAVSTTAPGWPWAVLWAASWWLQLVFVQPVLLARRMPQGSMLPRPVAATSGLLDCFAWHPSLVEFHWVSPFSSTWGLMLVATRAPFDCPCSFGCARLQCVSWCYWPPIPWPRSGCWVCPGPWFASLPLLDYGASAPMVRFVPMAVVGCLRAGYSMVRRLVLPLALTLDLFTDCRILYRNVPSARPRERVLSCFPSRRVLSCFPSHPFWAGYDYLRSNLCDLTFTAEEQDAVLVAPDSVAIPAEDFACSLVETSAMLEEALEISRDCVLLADMDGVLQADGEDLVNEAIPEAADSIIREVAAKILGADAPSDGSDPPIALAKMGPSPSASPPKSGLSKSAPAGLRRAAMPVVPEHQEFDEWCAARSRTPPANVAVHPFEARASSIPPPRPHKRQAPSSDPSRAKRSRASASSSSRIPSSTKAGMSSVNNSPAETARQSRREK